MVDALANPPPPPPPKDYNRKLAPPLIEAVKDGNLEQMQKLLKEVSSLSEI